MGQLRGSLEEWQGDHFKEEGASGFICHRKAKLYENRKGRRRKKP